MSIISPNSIDLLGEPLLQLGNKNSYQYQLKTSQEKIDNVRDVVIGGLEDSSDSIGVSTYIDDLGQEDGRLEILGESSISEITEGDSSSKNQGLLSKIIDFVKNIFRQIGDSISSVYRFLASSRNNEIDAQAMSSEELEINELLDDAFNLET